jgi:hypothetical protein
MIEQPATPLANLYAIFSTGPLLLMGIKKGGRPSGIYGFTGDGVAWPPQHVVERKDGTSDSRRALRARTGSRRGRLGCPVPQEPVLEAADSERRNCPSVLGVLSDLPEGISLRSKRVVTPPTRNVRNPTLEQRTIAILARSSPWRRGWRGECQKTRPDKRSLANTTVG